MFVFCFGFIWCLNLSNVNIIWWRLYSISQDFHAFNEIIMVMQPRACGTVTSTIVRCWLQETMPFYTMSLFLTNESQEICRFARNGMVFWSSSMHLHHLFRSLLLFVFFFSIIQFLPFFFISAAEDETINLFWFFACYTNKQTKSRSLHRSNEKWANIFWFWFIAIIIENLWFEFEEVLYIENCDAVHLFSPKLSAHGWQFVFGLHKSVVKCAQLIWIIPMATTLDLDSKYHWFHRPP